MTNDNVSPTPGEENNEAIDYSQMTDEERRKDKIAEFKYKLKHFIIGSFIMIVTAFGGLAASQQSTIASMRNNSDGDMIFFVITVAFFMITYAAFRNMMRIMKL